MERHYGLFRLLTVALVWATLGAASATAAWVNVDDRVAVTAADPVTADGITAIDVTVRNTSAEDIEGELRLLVFAAADPIDADGTAGEDGQAPTPYYAVVGQQEGIFEVDEAYTVTVHFDIPDPLPSFEVELNDASIYRDIFRKKISKTPELMSESALIKIMPVSVPAQNTKGEAMCLDPEAEDAKSELIPCSVGGEPTQVHPIVVTYVQAVEGTEFNSVWDYDQQGLNPLEDGTRPAHDIYAAVSLDDGVTWKRKNISRTATKSSYTLDNGVVYPGDSERASLWVEGPYVLVSWVDKYCRSGNPWDMAEEDDVYQVMGSQRAVDYVDVKGDDEPRYDLGTRPFSCVMVARGVLDMEPTVGDGEPNPAFGTVTWYKAEQVTTARRDAYQNFTAGTKPIFDQAGNAVAGTGGFAVSWQEDPKGLKTGKGRGPGAGMSGSCVNHKTDIWYSYIAWEDFATVDEAFVPSEGGDSAEPVADGGGNSAYFCTCGHIYDPSQGDPEHGVAPGTKFVDLPAEWTCPACGALQEDFAKVSKPHALVSLSPPVRMTDNNVCRERFPEAVEGYRHVDGHDCEYTYEGDTTKQVAWEELPADWTCPLCGGDQSTFVTDVIKYRHAGAQYCLDYQDNPRVNKSGGYVGPEDPLYVYAYFTAPGEWVDAEGSFRGNAAAAVSYPQDADGRATGEAFIGGTRVYWTGEPLDGNTGASRANLALANWDGQTLAVMAYEETKGIGAGSTEKAEKAAEQKAPIPLEVVTHADGSTSYLGIYTNENCVGCHYDNIVLRDRVIPVFDRETCEDPEGMNAVWREDVEAYWPYAPYPYDPATSAAPTAIGTLTRCVKFEQGRPIYAKDSILDGYHALPDHLPGWHNRFEDCTSCHLPYGTKDLDGDGAPDRWDQCPGTPPTAEIDDLRYLDPEMQILNERYGCSDEQDPDDEVLSDHEKRERHGKNMVYHHFTFDDPEADAIGHGALVNLPNSLGNYENARRVRVVPQTMYYDSALADQVTLGLLYKQGLGGQGAPADAVLRLFRGGFEPSHLVDGHWNLSSSTPLAYKALPLPFCEEGTADETCVPTQVDTGVVNPDYDRDHKGHRSPKVELFEWTADNLADDSGWKHYLSDADGNPILYQVDSAGNPVRDAAGDLIEDPYNGSPVVDADAYGIPSIAGNPYENVFSTRLSIRGDFILTGFAYCTNWAAAKKAHDHYDYYVRWTDDGGDSWSLPVNVSGLKNHKETTSDPRILQPPASIGWWNYVGGSWQYFADNVLPADGHTDDVFFVAIGTQENIPEPRPNVAEFKEAEVFLDVTYTRAVRQTDGNFAFATYTKENSNYIAGSLPCLDADDVEQDYNGSDDTCVNPYRDNPHYAEYVEELDWFAKGDAFQGDIQIACSPDGNRLYGTWEQDLPLVEGDGQTHFQGTDIWFRKVGYASVAGDLNFDLAVDLADYWAFRLSLGACRGDRRFVEAADYDGDGCISYWDYRIWYGHFWAAYY